MGIRGLLKNIITMSKSNVLDTHISNYKNSIIAIDAENLLYKFSSHECTYNSNKLQQDYSYSFNLFTELIEKYLCNNIIPVFVFDGKPPILKQDTLSQRRDKKHKIKNKIEDLKKELIERCEQNSSILLSQKDTDLLLQITKEQENNPNISYEYRNSCKQFLSAFGFSVINTKCEAETYCVKLLMSGYVDYIFTDDSDVIAYTIAQFINRPELIAIPGRNYKIIMSKKDFLGHTNPHELQEYNILNILESFNMNPKQFIEYCILCGTDYGPKPKLTIDPFKLIKNFKTIECIIQDYGSLGEFDEKYKEIYNIYKDSDTNEDFIDIETVTSIDITENIAITTICVTRPTMNKIKENDVIDLKKLYVTDKSIFKMFDILRKYNKINKIEDPDIYFNTESLLINKKY